MRRAAGYGEEQNLADAQRLAAMLKSIYRSKKPVIARIHGAALAGGTGLAAVCDVAIATEAAKFGLTEVRLGLVPATIGPYVADAIGWRQARRYFLSAERIDAATALRIGLVHELVPAEALDARGRHRRGDGPGRAAGAVLVQGLAGHAARGLALG